jgi:5'-deoxynucleotidase YfbR-like HD superfamily hydrolase
MTCWFINRTIEEGIFMNNTQHLAITTRSGRQVNLLDPQYSQIDIGDIAHGLAYQCRFNGQTSRFYSIAQHSLMVASILPDHLKMAGLLHDAAEAYVGDVVQPLKVLLPDYQAIENRFAQAIGLRFNVDLDHHPEVKQADLIALATEKRDLLPREKCTWDLLKGIKPLDRLTLPMSPEQSEDTFMRVFMELLASRQRRPLKVLSYDVQLMVA